MKEFLATAMALAVLGSTGSATAQTYPPRTPLFDTNVKVMQPPVRRGLQPPLPYEFGGPPPKIRPSYGFSPAGRDVGARPRDPYRQRQQPGANDWSSPNSTYQPFKPYKPPPILR